MADSYSTRGGAAGKSRHASSTETLRRPVTQHGLVQHRLLKGGVQVKVLAKIDVQGWASVGEIIDLLDWHQDTTGAISVLLDAGIIVAELKGRPMDEATILRRPIEPDPALLPVLPGGGHIGFSADWQGNCELEATRAIFEPLLLRLDWCERRRLTQSRFWRRPGVYLLVAGRQIYVGASAELCVRACQGTQPIENIEAVCAVGDARGALTFEDALALERLMHMRLSVCREIVLVNDRPDGAVIDPSRFDDLQLLAGQFALFIARHAIAFAGQSSRNILAGPRHEQAFATTLRIFDEMPSGVIHELEFNGGLRALAVCRENGDWIVLRHSEVRIETVPSANSTASYHRAALLHSGVLVPAVNRSCYVLTRDLRFPSRCAAAHFLTGSKGQGRGGWKPIDPNGGHARGTDLPIAS